MRPGELIVFEPAETPIRIDAAPGEDAVFVLGSALRHPHALHLASYSVHTSEEALEEGERRIEELRLKMVAAGNRRTAPNSVPVFK